MTTTQLTREAINEVGTGSDRTLEGYCVSAIEISDRLYLESA
jgi:hypothetical protein